MKGKTPQPEICSPLKHETGKESLGAEARSTEANRPNAAEDVQQNLGCAYVMVNVQGRGVVQFASAPCNNTSVCLLEGRC